MKQVQLYHNCQKNTKEAGAEIDRGVSVLFKNLPYSTYLEGWLGLDGLLTGSHHCGCRACLKLMHCYSENDRLMRVLGILNTMIPLVTVSQILLELSGFFILRDNI